MKRWASIGIIFLAVVTALGSILYDDGIFGVTKKPGGKFQGCICHGEPPSAPSPWVNVWIQGPDTVLAGSDTTFHILIANHPNIAAGFDVAVFFGDVDTMEGEGTWTDSTYPQEISHAFPKASGGHDTIQWAFRYRAPDTTDLIDTIYANGNSVNLSGDPDTGDHWNFAENFLVTVHRSTNPVLMAAHPETFDLFPNYPNPFNPSTRFAYALPSAGVVDVRVYNMVGQLVRTLFRGVQGAGRHEMTWDGRDDADRPAGSGVYVVRVATPSSARARKMMLLK